MRVIYHNGNQQGYGILIISQLAFVPGEIGFVLKRASDRKCLSPGGWQEAEISLQPLQYHWIDDDLHLMIGPQVVDCLDMQDGYRLYLHLADGSAPNAGFKAEAIVYSPLSGGQGIGGSPAAVPPPLTELAPLPPRDKPDEKLDGKPEEKPEETPPVPQVPPDITEPVSQARSRLPLLLILALLVIAAAALLYVFSGKEAEQIPPLRQAHEYLAQEKTNAEESLNLGLRLAADDSSDAQDAAFLLYEDAAQKGNAQAMLLMARYYDPLDSKPNGSIIKEAEQALNWYEKALAAGEKSAEAKINALKKWMEENAAP